MHGYSRSVRSISLLLKPVQGLPVREGSERAASPVTGLANTPAYTLHSTLHGRFVHQGPLMRQKAPTECHKKHTHSRCRCANSGGLVVNGLRRVPGGAANGVPSPIFRLSAASGRRAGPWLLWRSLRWLLRWLLRRRAWLLRGLPASLPFGPIFSGRLSRRRFPGTRLPLNATSPFELSDFFERLQESGRRWQDRT